MDTAQKWLAREWWGLLISYAIATALMYSLIWAAIEPLDIPSTFASLPHFLSQRLTYHIAGAFFIGAHLTLGLELLLRRSKWRAWAPREAPFDKLYAVGESKSFYDSISGEYDQRNSTSLLRTHEQVIRSVKDALHGRHTKAVLDLGAGTGKLIAHHFFDSADIKWVCVDASPLMVEQFTNNLKGTKLATEIVLDDINSYLARPANATFDVIVMSLVLTSMQHSPDWKRLAGHLKKDGRLLVADIDAAYTATYPYYIVKAKNLRHALQPKPVPFTQLIHEVKAGGLELLHSHPIADGAMHYAFVAEFAVHAT